MINFSNIGKRAAFLTACLALLLSTAISSFAQSAPTLGTVAPFGAFSGTGAIDNTGLTIITGDIGTYAGSVTGFPPGIYTGAYHVADPVSLTAKNDLTLAYNSLNDATHAVMYDTALGATMGNGQVLTPRTYGRGDLTTIAGNLTFDAKGNPDAIFIIKIGAALNVAGETQILLANGAQSANIYWAVNGAVSILDNSSFRGTILANGAISLYGGTSLAGRALSVVGSVTLASNMVTVPTAATPASSLVVTTPAAGDSIESGTQNYQIRWEGTGIAPMKTFEYSIDGGSTWMLIGTMTGDGNSYEWGVPEAVSNRALVRVTDANNLSDTSGMFAITERKAPAGSIIVVRPSAGEVIAGGTKDYQITYTSTNSTLQKTLEYSLDGGASWTLIGITSTEAPTWSWADVPNVATSQTLVRITDRNGATGTSGMFTITMTPGAGSINSLTLRGLDARNNIGNSQPLGIDWTFTPEIGTSVTLEYSLDRMVTWVPFAVVPTTDAPNATWTTPPAGNYEQVFIRITSSDGMTRTSAPFSISSTVASVATDAARNGYAVSNHPNPANGRTTINFVLPLPAVVTLTIVDELGREVGSSTSGQFHAGSHAIDINTSRLAPGMYAYIVQAGTTRLFGRMMVVR